MNDPISLLVKNSSNNIDYFFLIINDLDRFDELREGPSRMKEKYCEIIFEITFLLCNQADYKAPFLD